MIDREKLLTLVLKRLMEATAANSRWCPACHANAYLDKVDHFRPCSYELAGQLVKALA